MNVNEAEVGTLLVSGARPRHQGFHPTRCQLWRVEHWKLHDKNSNKQTYKPDLFSPRIGFCTAPYMDDSP